MRERESLHALNNLVMCGTCAKGYFTPKNSVYLLQKAFCFQESHQNPLLSYRSEKICTCSRISEMFCKELNFFSLASYRKGVYVSQRGLGVLLIESDVSCFTLLI